MRKLEKYLCLALFGFITIVFGCICFAQGKTIRVWLPCQNTNPGRWRRNWTRTPTIPQSDLRSWSATNKEVLRKSQRGKYQERNSSTGITHELHCVCTKWLNHMTQGRASSATKVPKSDLLGSKSEEIQMKNTHGTLWLDQLIFQNWTGLQTENYCCRNYTVVDVSLSRPGARQARLFSEFPYLKPIIKVWHQYLGGCLKYL